jgi:hypothetical protein
MSTREISCPKCSASFQLGSSLRPGRHLRCPYCGAYFTVTARRSLSRSAWTRPLVSALLLGAFVILLIGVMGGLGVAAAWSRPAPAPAPVTGPVAVLPARHEDRHHPWSDRPATPAITVTVPTPAPTSTPVPALPAPAQSATADQCQPAAADVLAGKWQIPLAGGVSFYAEFKPDASLTYTIASPGANATLGQYQAEGLTVQGTWKWQRPGMLALQMTGAEFRTAPSVVDPAQIAGLRLGDLCKVVVVDRNMLVVTSLREQQHVELTRVPC